MDRVPGARRRSSTRKSPPLELRRHVPPVDSGHGFEQRLAETFDRWFPYADGRSHRAERRASEGEGRSGGPEGGISLAETPIGRLEAQGPWRVSRDPVLKKGTDGRMDRVPGARRRSTTRKSPPLELRRHVPPVDSGHGFEQRLAETFLRWFPYAEGRWPWSEGRASEGEERSDGPERGISVAKTHASMVRWRIFQTERDATIAEGCIFLARTHIFRPRAIVVVVARLVFQACEDPTMSRPRVFPTRGRLSRARSRVSPPGMRIFQAGRCTRRRDAHR